MDLGAPLPAGYVQRAIKAVYDHNFQRSFRNHLNCQRTFALNDESGLILCSWPDGQKPRLPFVYSDEVWTGVEYQVASQLIYEGWVEEGLALVTAIRERHDGYRRNPWDEVECGHHYARSMSSWGLILALSGFQCSNPDHSISFKPAIETTDFKTFFSNGKAWGTFEQHQQGKLINAQIQIQHGCLELARLRLSVPGLVRSITMAGDDLEGSPKYQQEDGLLDIHLEPGIKVPAGQYVQWMIQIVNVNSG